MCVLEKSSTKTLLSKSISQAHWCTLTFHQQLAGRTASFSIIVYPYQPASQPIYDVTMAKMSQELF